MDDEGLRRACERLVDVLMVGEADEAEARQGGFDRTNQVSTKDESAGSVGGGAAAEFGRAERGNGSSINASGGFVQAVEDEDEDNEIVPIF